MVLQLFGSFQEEYYVFFSSAAHVAFFIPPIPFLTTTGAYVPQVDKTHFSMKYDLKKFMEAEFARRNLFKQTAKDSGK
jgi:hypothetical protein